MTSKSSRCKSFYTLGVLFINKEIATAHMTSALLMERHAGLTMTVMRRTQSICADRHRQEPKYTDETVLLFVDPTSHFVLHGGRLVAFQAHSRVSSLSPELFGHWRTTVIIGGSPLDTNLVLKPDGSATRWTVTARGRDAPESGSWSVVGNTLVLNFGGQVQQSPYTLYKTQLVFPNISNRRRFWDRV